MKLKLTKLKKKKKNGNQKFNGFDTLMFKGTFYITTNKSFYN